MSITAQRVREMVAGLADAQEGAHHGHPDFRVNNKIFATLSEAEDRSALRLTSIEARALAERTPAVFRLVSDREPVTWVSVLLAGADEPEFSDLLEEAWSLRVNEPPSRVTRGRRK
ncbi:MAG TPA: MmcQ/YjbR family DNA-binding protein [Chloroflexota bacterium]|jgi:predicted DNA-binding protein (MmcQ/YjbR family)